MSKNNDRLEFLRGKFNIFEFSDENLELKDFIGNLENEGYTWTGKLMNEQTSEEIAYMLNLPIVKTNNSGEKIIKNKPAVLVSEKVFDNMISADPTKNKTNTQWMLNIFTNLIKHGETVEARRFAEEDLPQAKEYLTIFEGNKRKKKFKEYCKTSYVLKGVTDPTNINQYKSLSQLYDAVDPFIERDASEIEKTMNKFVQMGQAEIPVKDRKFTVFIPLSTEANAIFGDFAGWCTAKPGNSMFKSYTTNNKKPDGTKSTIYIVIDHRFYEGETSNNLLYQIHFETKQVRNRNQSGENFFEDVILKSEGVANFFNSELTELAKSKFTFDNNVYLDYLVKFGWTQALFDLMEEVTPVIRFIGKEVPRLANMTRFKELRQLIICDSKLCELHPSINKLHNLETLALSRNKLKVLPKEIGDLKNLAFLNIIGNPIKEIPDEIKYLDKSNGGSLERIAVKESDVGVKNYKKLKTLLPTTNM